MTNPEISRRRLIKLSVAALAALPLSHLIPASSRAATAARVEESDPLAQELGYRHDATSAGNGQFCKGCQFFQGDASAEWAPCTVFSGKHVNAQGWCKSWYKRAS